MTDQQLCITVDWTCALSQTEIAALDPVKKSMAEVQAQTAIRVLTGQRAAQCPVTVRPCAARASIFPLSDDYGPNVWMYPYIIEGRLYNGCGHLPGNCNCYSLDRVLLAGPVAEVLEVKVDGIVVNPAEYRVDDFSYLVRTGGESWPATQDLSLPDIVADTMAITYRKGVAWDQQAACAAGALANEYYLAMSEDGHCRLPAGVTQYVRSGMTFEVGADLFPNNKTNIPSVDLWVASINPYGQGVRPKVFSPDRKAHRRTTIGG